MKNDFYLVLWSKCFVFVNFHLNIEFTLFGDELKGSLNWFDGKIKWNTVFIFVSTFPCENFSWFITARCVPVNTVVVDIIWIFTSKSAIFGSKLSHFRLILVRIVRFYRFQWIKFETNLLFRGQLGCYTLWMVRKW